MSPDREAIHQALYATRAPHTRDDPTDDADGWVHHQACACPYYVPLAGSWGQDWGVIMHPESQKFGQLVFEHEWCGCASHPAGVGSLHEQQQLEAELNQLVADLERSPDGASGTTGAWARHARVSEDIRVRMQFAADGTRSVILDAPGGHHTMHRDAQGEWHPLDGDPALIRFALLQTASPEWADTPEWEDVHSFAYAWRGATQLVFWVMLLQEEPRLAPLADQLLEAIRMVDATSGKGWPALNQLVDELLQQSQQSQDDDDDASTIAVRDTQQRIQRAYLWSVV